MSTQIYDAIYIYIYKIALNFQTNLTLLELNATQPFQHITLRTNNKNYIKQA